MYIGLNRFFQLLVNAVEVLRHDFNVGENRHKIGVAVPARHDMQVQMTGKTRSGTLSLIYAHIVAIGIHRLIDDAQGKLRLHHHLRQRGRFYQIERANMSKGGYHEMPIIVWVAIEHDKTMLASIEDIILCVLLLGGQRAKNAALPLRGLRLDIVHAPGRP